jgi:HlyD family secretion protein
VASSAPSGGIVSRLLPRPPTQKTGQQQAAKAGATRVWVLRDGQPVAVPVQTGPSNGRQTEITGGDLKTGVPVIVEYMEAKK